MKARIFLEKHPTLTFYALVFAISWGGILLVVGGPAAIPSTWDRRSDPLIRAATTIRLLVTNH